VQFFKTVSAYPSPVMKVSSFPPEEPLTPLLSSSTSTEVIVLGFLFNLRLAGSFLKIWQRHQYPLPLFLPPHRPNFLIWPTLVQRGAFFHHHFSSQLLLFTFPFRTTWLPHFGGFAMLAFCLRRGASGLSVFPGILPPSALQTTFLKESSQFSPLDFYPRCPSATDEKASSPPLFPLPPA